jgi:glutamate dehydrogenase
LKVYSFTSVNKYPEKIMTGAFTEVLEMSQHLKVAMREAAYMLSIKRMADAMEARGIFP